jgi:hypothetical protein
MRIVFSLTEHPFIGTTLIWAAMAFVWGLWMVTPVGTFAAGIIYTAMLQVVPEWVWGTMMLAAGTAMFAGVITRRAYLIKNASLFAATIYLALTVLYFMSAPTSIPAIVAAFITLNYAWIGIQAKLRPSLFARNILDEY